MRNLREFPSANAWKLAVLLIVLGFGLCIVLPLFLFTACYVDVPATSILVRVKKTGQDLPNHEEIAPSSDYKGVQREVLGSGRHFLNPYTWDWEVVPQVEIPEGTLGVRIRLYGDELPYGEIIAASEGDAATGAGVQKGIAPDVLRAGRYPLNALIVDKTRGKKINPLPRREQNYAEIVEVYDPVSVPAGYKGVVTNLTGKMPADPNVLVVGPGERGVEEDPLDTGTYYVNPYVQRISLIDCRSQRFTISNDGDMGFPTKDGFWVTLDGVIEFRVMASKAAEVFVVYNETKNDLGGDAQVDKEVIEKVILPNARSFCRLRGSDQSGKDFISGETRTQFQADFQAAMVRTCKEQGIEIVQALITKIHPPQQIAGPVRDREIAVEEEKQYVKQAIQQVSEKDLAVEKELINRGKDMVAAEQQIVKLLTVAEKEQEVEVIEAQQRLEVAKIELEAAQDLADAVASRGKAEADVIAFQNTAEAAGWKKAVTSFGGDGGEYARYVLLQKLAPSFRRMMVNTADSPLMDIFREYQMKQPANPAKAPAANGAKP